MLKGNGAYLTHPFTPPPSSLPPRMLRVKDSLKDGLGRVVTSLRLSVTDTCNLDCAHCHQQAGTRARSETPAMRRSEAIRLVKVFTSLGILKVRLTGGEPLLRRDLEPLIAGISPEAEGGVHLNTHGTLLARRARGLHEAGLSGVDVSLPAADRATFERLTHKNRFDRIMTGLETARSAGLKVQLRTMVFRGWNEDQILPLARLAQTEGFPIEFLDGTSQEGHGWMREACMSAAEILRALQVGLGTELQEEAGFMGEESRERRFHTPTSHSKVSIISTFGAPSCDRCNRVYLDSRGQLKACLSGHRSVDLLDALRHQASHADLVRLIRQAITEKRACPPRRQGELTSHAARWQVGG